MTTNDTTMIQRIHILGASGSGTTTLGRALAERLQCPHFDTDDYFWLRNKGTPEVVAYLEAENAYTAHRTRHVEPLADRIVEEIRARTKETDLSVPVRHGGWWYYGRTVEGLQYGIAGRIDLATFPERPVLDTAGPPHGEQAVRSLGVNQLEELGIASDEPREVFDLKYVNAVSVRAHGDAPVQIDGELIGHLPMRFEIAPQSLNVIVP